MSTFQKRSRQRLQKSSTDDVPHSNTTYHTVATKVSVDLAYPAAILRQCFNIRKCIFYSLNSYKPKTKTVQFTLYPDEYDMLMTRIYEKGYKKNEFLLACVAAAKKNSMEANYTKYEALRKERRAADRQAAKNAKTQKSISLEKEVS